LAFFTSHCKSGEKVLTQVQEITSPMTGLERRATFSLASIYALRMMGLFMMFPVLSLFAEHIPQATPLLIGVAISVYGLSQALLQIPLGLLSDRFGRKKIIIIGLLVFAAGSVVAATADDIYELIIGRALQGSGAIAATIMAFVADLTQEVHRTKAMATIGASIAIAFGIAITSGTLIASYIGVTGIFWAMMGLALLAILVVIFIVPNPIKSIVHCDAELVPNQFSNVIKNPALLRLDYGIFTLHLILTASFVIVPLLIKQGGLAPAQHWRIYLPVLISAMLAVIPFVILAEKKRKLRAVFLGAIILVITAEMGLSFAATNLLLLSGFLGLFFCGFNLLEATMPSLVSKTAPSDLRGTAMGIYSSSQFMGSFMGGLLGGWLYGDYGATLVFLGCAIMATLWLIIALFMQPPSYFVNMLIPLEIDKTQASDFLQELLAIEGIKEAKLNFEEQVAYLKIDELKLEKQALQTFSSKWSQH
jgi:predicted MFS family arabinose efflux permease